MTSPPGRRKSRISSTSRTLVTSSRWHMLATLLQDAASDWWHSLLTDPRGSCDPRNFVEFADLLGQRLWEQYACRPSSRGAQRTSGKDSLRQSGPIRPALRHCWANYPAGKTTGRNPSFCGDCMEEWPSWSRFHPRRHCMLQFAKRSRSKWHAPLPTWVAPNNSHEEVQDGGARGRGSRGRFSAVQVGPTGPGLCRAPGAGWSAA